MVSPQLVVVLFFFDFLDAFVFIFHALCPALPGNGQQFQSDNVTLISLQTTKVTGCAPCGLSVSHCPVYVPMIRQCHGQRYHFKSLLLGMTVIL